MAENKVFYDILPPQRSARQVETPEIEQKKQRRERTTQKKDGGRGTGRKLVILFLILIIFGGGYLFYLKMQRVEIKIWPATESLNIEKEIMAQQGATIDPALSTLPVSILEIEKSDSQKFPSSFVAEERKAEGTIRVYNLYSIGILTLRVQSRFLSDSGKLFIAQEKIVIPGKVMEKGKWVPGSVDVKVVAAEPGSDYNIAPTKFSLPGLVGGNLYTLVYGESLSSMKGGASGRGHQILSEDLESAEKIISAKIKQANIENLRKKAEEADSVLIEETAVHQVVEKSASEPLGAAVDEFTYNIKVKTKVLSFKQGTLEEAVEEMLASQAPKEKMVWEESVKTSWEAKDKDIEKGKAFLVLKISAKLSDKFNKNELLDNISGKSINETVFLLKNQFEKAEIKSVPFWLKRVPKSLEKIKLEIIIE